MLLEAKHFNRNIQKVWKKTVQSKRRSFLQQGISLIITDFLTYVLIVYSGYRIGNKNKSEDLHSFIYIEKNCYKVKVKLNSRCELKL